MRPVEVRAAVRESADLGQWLGNKVHRLFSTPIEIVAFSDEEGVRCGLRCSHSHTFNEQQCPDGAAQACILVIVPAGTTSRQQAELDGAKLRWAYQIG